jgi:hypothetical protein
VPDPIAPSPAAADFIEVFHDALAPDTCAKLIEHFERSGQATPGQVGSGVMPELKKSRDITITGRPEWVDVENLLNQAVFGGLIQYMRRYCYALIAPLMLQIADPVSGKPRRLEPADIEQGSDDFVAGLMRACFRPGAINLQHYRADQGGYPYWHCELFPKDANCEPLHRHLLWTIYLNDGFAEGETEFVYQRRKIQPRTGSLLIAPTAFTHTHRGNRPLGADKYIATSWVLFQRAETLFGQPAQM